MKSIVLDNTLGIKKPERLKSAPYLRLKNSKRTSKRVSKYSLLWYRKNPKVEPNWRTRGDTLRFFIHSVANHQTKRTRGTFGEKKLFLKKSLTMPKKTERRDPLGIFQHPFCRKTPKIEGETLRGKISYFRKKSLE